MKNELKFVVVEIPAGLDRSPRIMGIYDELEPAATAAKVGAMQWMAMNGPEYVANWRHYEDEKSGDNVIRHKTDSGRAHRWLVLSGTDFGNGKV